MNRNAINWFEIPTIDFERAVAFYNTILNAQLEIMEFGELAFANLPFEGEGVQGALVKSVHYAPSKTGVIIYINVNGLGIDSVVEKVEKAGGSIFAQKKDLGHNGFSAIIIDTEGNKVGLHESKS